MRLTRLGDKKSPFYRIVVIDSHKARDGQYVEQIGTYNPLTNPADVKIDTVKAKKWIDCGVQPTDTVRALLVKAGVIEPRKVIKRKPKVAPVAKSESAPAHKA